MKSSTTPYLLLVPLVLVLGAGCYARAGYRGHVYARAAPPAPYVEVVSEPPAAQYVWVNGYWWWNGAEYVWIRGHWALPPEPGYVYVRSGWVHTDGDYRFVHGRWVAPSHRVRAHYVHPTPRVRVESGVRYRTVHPGRTHVRTRRR